MAKGTAAGLLAILAALSPGGAMAEEKAPAPPPARPTRADLDAALARGVKFLLSDQQADGGWISREYGLDSAGHTTAITAAAMDAVLAGAGPTPEALEAVRRGLAFLQGFAAGIDGGKVHHGFDFNGWGAAYGLRHLAGVRDRWPAGQKAPDLARLADLFTGWARKNRRPCGGWTYLTKETVPGSEKDGSVSFLTGVMIEGLARWDPKSPLLDPAAEDLSRSCGAEGRVTYLHLGDWKENPRGREEPAGRSLQAAFVLAGLGLRTPEDVEKRLAEFFEVRQEFVKVRTQHPHTPPHMIAGYYYYHAHSYAARALRMLAAREAAPTAVRAARVGELLSALLAEQDGGGAWMDAPCGDRPYATSLAVLELLDLRELLFPWAGSLEGALAAAREKGAPVVVLFADGGADSRKAEEALAAKDLDPVRERVLWARVEKADAAAWKAAKSPRAGSLLVLGPEGGYDLARPAAKFGPGAGAKLLLRQVEKMLPR